MFINILTKGGFRGAFRGCTCLKCTSLSKDTLMRVFFFVGALETSAPPEIRTCLKCTPYKAPPNGYKSKYFVRNNIYLLVIVNHCANVYLGVWKKNIHNFAQKHTNV